MAILLFLCHNQNCTLWRQILKELSALNLEIPGYPGNSFYGKNCDSLRSRESRNKVQSGHHVLIIVPFYTGPRGFVGMGVGGPPGRPMGPRSAITQPPRPLMDFGDQTVFSSPDQMQVCIIPTTCSYLQKGWRHCNWYLALNGFLFETAQDSCLSYPFQDCKDCKILIHVFVRILSLRRI